MTSVNDSQLNALHNEKHYDSIYESVRVQPIIDMLEGLPQSLDYAAGLHTSWVGLYRENFGKELNGKRVLELGCGDCTNAAVMAALGAEVYANDISSEPGRIIDELNANYKFHKPLTYILGDFLLADIPDDFFDIVVGKSFVHHLTLEQEEAFLKKIVSILKPTGSVRFFETAVNSKFVDALRWMIPVSGRPSTLQREKFREWKEADPHPERDNSSRHYAAIGKKYFAEVDIFTFGSLERFARFIPKGKLKDAFRRFSYKVENILPQFIVYPTARCQTIDYKKPRKKS